MEHVENPMVIDSLWDDGEMSTSEMILDGIMCETCGEFIDWTGTGYPRECEDCEEIEEI